MKSWGNAPETEESGKAGAMPRKCKRAEKLGQCPRKEKRQMIGSEEEYAPVVCAFQFFRISIFVRGGEDLKTTCFDYME